MSLLSIWKHTYSEVYILLKASLTIPGLLLAEGSASRCLKCIILCSNGFSPIQCHIITKSHLSEAESSKLRGDGKNNGKRRARRKSGNRRWEFKQTLETMPHSLLCFSDNGSGPTLCSHTDLNWKYLG
jgi:hypothetical protein